MKHEIVKLKNGCKAKIYGVPTYYGSFENLNQGNQQCFYRGRVDIYENNKYAWNEAIEIDRLNEEDAMHDCKKWIESMDILP